MQTNILTTENPYDNKWYCAAINLINKDINRLRDDSELRKFCRICEYLTEHEEFGNAMTIQDIVENVESCCILNYDGIGKFVSYEDFSEEYCRDVENIAELKKRNDTHFFVWYNK